MISAVTQFLHKVRFKIFYLLFGLSVGSGGLILAQTCPGLGQCASCSRCLPMLPLLAIYILAKKNRGKIVSSGKGVWWIPRRLGHD